MVLISELPTRRGVSLLAGIDPRWGVCQRVSVGTWKTLRDLDLAV